MKCKYNRNHLKIPNSCLEGLRRCVDALRRRSTHHLRVRHRAEAGNKYIRLDFRHVLCWERRNEKPGKGAKEVTNAKVPGSADGCAHLTSSEAETTHHIGVLLQNLSAAVS